MNQYEAMFLFDPTFGAAFEKCEAEVRRLMERAQAEILVCQRWDDRRLAYKIKGRKRGVYVLVYFKAPGDKIGPLERDARLSENILRLLVLRADELTLEQMEHALRRHQTELSRGEGEPGGHHEGGEVAAGVGGRHGGRHGGPRRGGHHDAGFDAVPDME